MIGKLSGTLDHKNPPEIIIDCRGVGYEVQVPMSTFYHLGQPGSAITLLIHMIVREDAQILYGFATAPEREAFRQLIKISGIGPRMALSILSGMSVTELAQAISLQQAGQLVKVPGIGKKTAERLLLELKDKFGAGPGSSAAAVNGQQNDILQALLALGYSEREASAALQALAPDTQVEEGIKQALKNLSN